MLCRQPASLPRATDREDAQGWGGAATCPLSLHDLQQHSTCEVERGGEPAEEQTPPSPLDIQVTRLCQHRSSPHLSRCQLLLGPQDPQRLLHVSPHLSLQAAVLMCLTVLFVILQSRVPTLQGTGKKSQAWKRTWAERGTRRNAEEEVCGVCTPNGDEKRDRTTQEKQALHLAFWRLLNQQKVCVSRCVSVLRV